MLDFTVYTKYNGREMKVRFKRAKGKCPRSMSDPNRRDKVETALDPEKGRRVIRGDNFPHIACEQISRHNVNQLHLQRSFSRRIWRVAFE